MLQDECQFVHWKLQIKWNQSPDGQAEGGRRDDLLKTHCVLDFLQEHNSAHISTEGETNANTT